MGFGGNMSRRKIIFDISVIAVAFLLFITWHRWMSQKDIKIKSTSSARDDTIYLITTDKEDQFWKYVNKGAADMAALLGVTYIWDAPEEKDTMQQIEVLNRAVEHGADAIMIAANDAMLLSGPIRDAMARGVKIVYVDIPAYEEAVVTLATNNFDAGIMSGEIMISEFSELGIKTGTIGIIGVNTETISTMDRESGFREVIDNDGRFVILPTAYGNGDPEASEASALEFINNNIDLVGLLGTNEGATIGIGNAIRASQKNRIVGVGFGTSKEIIELVNDGTLDAILVQNPYTMGYLGMAEAFASLRGFETGPPFINTGVSIIRSR